MTMDVLVDGTDDAVDVCLFQQVKVVTIKMRSFLATVKMQQCSVTLKKKFAEK